PSTWRSRRSRRSPRGGAGSSAGATGCASARSSWGWTACGAISWGCRWSSASTSRRSETRGRTAAGEAAAFRALHARPGAFIIPNPWDAGTAKLLASLGFEALATTSLGLANLLGRVDGAGAVSRAEVLDNCRAIAGATDLPVNADLENGYA